MVYESRAYDDEYGEPVVVLVTSGTHDVSRLVNLLQGRMALCEHIGVADQILRQVRRHNGGRRALALLKAHGGPDFTRDKDEVRDGQALAGLMVAAEQLLLQQTPAPQHRRAVRAAIDAVEERFFGPLAAVANALSSAAVPAAEPEPAGTVAR